MILNEFESGKIISKYLKLVKQEVINPNKEISTKLKYPLFVKGISSKITHAKKMGFLKKVDSISELNKAVTEFKRNAEKQKIKLDGILIQEMALGQEFIIGIKKDHTFGHVIMLGIGGSHAEEIKDVTFRVCPITKKDAKQMVNDLQNKAIVKMINEERLVNSLLRISSMTKDYKKLVELDINPIIINEKEAFVVDTLVVFE